MTTKEKAAGVLDTPTTASKELYPQILSAHDADRKHFTTLQALFALRGYSLRRSHRADDGRITYFVELWTQTRAFSHPHDVRAHLARIGGAHV